MILRWRNHVGAFLGAHRYLTVGILTQYPQAAGVVVPRGKGRPTVRYIDRQAILLWAELRVPEPIVDAAGLETLQPGISPPAEPAPLILSGATAYKPKAPTPILVLDAAAVMVRAEMHVPTPPLQLSPDEYDEALAIMFMMED